MSVVFIHNHFTSADRTPPWRYGPASHHSLTVSSSCWLAGAPEDTRQPDTDTGRYAHTDVYYGRCRLHGDLPVVSSVLLFINLSKTIKDCQHEWQRGKEREQRKRKEIAHFFSYDYSCGCIWYLTSFFCLITLFLAFCCSWNVLRDFLKHRDAPPFLRHTQGWENAAIKTRVLWAACILHCHVII